LGATSIALGGREVHNPTAPTDPGRPRVVLIVDLSNTMQNDVLALLHGR